MGSVAGSKSFVDENEAVNRILQVVCAEMRLLWASRTNSPKKLTHIRMAEPPKEEERMSLMPIPRHSALNHITLRRALHLSIQRNYLSEEMF